MGGRLCVESFREKPDIQTAEESVRAGNYYWNSGMFGFTVGCFQTELAVLAPDIADLAAKPWKVVIETLLECQVYLLIMH